jgi:hypothetical protein
MRVFNWAAIPKPGWFINDGIHYTAAGYEKRALFIADGLAEAFPAGGAKTSCLVSLPSSVIAAASATPTASPSPSSTSASPPSGPAARGQLTPGLVNPSAASRP